MKNLYLVVYYRYRNRSMLQHETVPIDWTPTKRSGSGKIIPHSPAKVHEGYSLGFLSDTMNAINILKLVYS